jgi:hypothetical protein
MPPLYSPSRFLATEFSTGAKFSVSQLKQIQIGEGSFSQAVKGWGMVFLTLTFVVLYGLALVGKLRPLADVSMVSRLEPIIFVIVGYYFGRLPSQQNEQTLKDEIGRQTQRADAAQHAKETALQSREVLDEKVKNARTALAADALALGKGTTDPPDNGTRERGSVAAAFNILSS